MRTERAIGDKCAVVVRFGVDELLGAGSVEANGEGREVVDQAGHVQAGRRRGTVHLGGEVIRVPRQMPDGAPFVTVYSQSELMHDAAEGIALPPDTDHPPLRYYEVTGVPHLRLADHGTQHTEALAADVGKADDPRCQVLYDEPAEVVVAALLDAMDTWVREGKPMPKSPRVERKDKAVVRDARNGNMIGGVRPPWIAVPSAAYMTDAETGCGLIYDTKIAYDKQRLRKLYGNYQNYRRKFAAAKAAAIKEHYLLPDDASYVNPVARPEDF